MSAQKHLLPCIVLALSPACAIFQSEIDRESVGEHLALAQEEIDRGEPLRGLDRLGRLREVERLDPEIRRDIETRIHRTTNALLDEYEEKEAGSSEYFTLYELPLPDTLRATAGIMGCRRLFHEGHQVSASKRVREIDRRLPNHGARALGGDVLGEIGLWLIRNEHNYYGVFSYRKRGVTALEYLIVYYPSALQCADAYLELSRYYEDTGDLDYAIERLEDLVANHFRSEHSVAAQARLPYLRMERLTRDDFDRSELELAAAEIDRWLRLYPGHELEEWMRRQRLRSRARLASNDLVLARYYRKVGSPTGARLHAQRALATAEEGGAAEEASAARELLARLPEGTP